MKPSEIVADRNSQLQQEAIGKLDLISQKIDSGDLSLEEGIAQAEGYLKEVEARSSSLLNEHNRDVQQSKRLKQLLMAAACILPACLVFKLYSLFMTPAS